MSNGCPKHPMAGVWLRDFKLFDVRGAPCCAICGDPLDGGTLLTENRPQVGEPLEVRSFATYRELVARTDSAKGRFPLEYHAGCLGEEAGEFFGKVKKVVYHQHPFDGAMRAKMVEELGDVLWYLDRCAERVGVTLEQVAAANIEKLRKRYPDGFDPARSRDRKE